MRLEVKVAEEDAPRIIVAAPDAGGASASELPDVKPTNEDGMEDRTDGRGGVDDLIELAHLHEPAILHVLVRGGPPRSPCGCSSRLNLAKHRCCRPPLL